MKLSNVICAFAGVAVGAGVTYLITSTEIKRSEEEKREEEIAEMRAYYSDKIAELQMQREIVLNQLKTQTSPQMTMAEALGISDDFPQDDIEFEDAPEEAPAAEEVVEEEEYIPKTSLTGKTYPAKKKKATKKKEKKEEEKKVETVKDSRWLSTACTLISDRDFDEEEDFCKVSMVWNPVSLILFDEDNSEADIDNSITEEALDHFGEYMPEKVFVRNENTRCVYEVTRDEDWEG